MALTLTKQNGSNAGDDLSGTYTFIKLGSDYEFERNAETNTVTVRKAEYESYTTQTMKPVDFGDAQVFSCKFTASANGQEDYTPDGGLKLWKIQRKVYRLIGSAERVSETTLYYDGELEVSHNRVTELPYTMKINEDDDTWVHFDWLDANGRMAEIMNQCDSNGIQCTVTMRLKSGKCVSVSTTPVQPSA